MSAHNAILKSTKSIQYLIRVKKVWVALGGFTKQNNLCFKHSSGIQRITLFMKLIKTFSRV